MKRISMWSGPRNVSTAIMYSFRQRPDTLVIDEPLYAAYLKQTNKKHPGSIEVLGGMENDAEKVLSDVIFANYDSDIIFFKNMAHHLLGLEQDFLNDLDNILLCRDPKEMLPSLAKNIENPSLLDTGLLQQTQILDLIIAKGQEPIVLDAKETLLNPERVLKQVCKRLEIPFYNEMLAWPAGPKTEDGIWAKYWYHNVHKSISFTKYQPKTSKFPEHLNELYQESKALYDRLYSYAIKAK